MGGLAQRFLTILSFRQPAFTHSPNLAIVMWPTCALKCLVLCIEATLTNAICNQRRLGVVSISIVALAQVTALR